jgi:hypothetical protein
MAVACSTVLAAGAVTAGTVLWPSRPHTAASVSDESLAGVAARSALARSGLARSGLASTTPAARGPGLATAITTFKSAHSRTSEAAALATAQQAARAQAARLAAQRAAAQREAAARQAAAQQAQQPQQPPPAPAPAPAPAPPPVTAGSAQQIAESLLGAYGWSSSQFSCLDDLWSRESGWNVTAENPSGAYGIPQALPGSKMASAGPDWQTDATTQIRWGLGYIKGSYGSPCGAWSHEEATGWY